MLPLVSSWVWKVTVPFFLFFPFGQHPFLQTAVSLSALPEAIRIARKICKGMEAIHANSEKNYK